MWAAQAAARYQSLQFCHYVRRDGDGLAISLRRSDCCSQFGHEILNRCGR